jgi:Fe-S cluster assembly protein SufD
MAATLDQAIAEKESRYVSAFANTNGIGPQWLHDTRRAAIDSFTRLGFPTTRNEDWKFTNIARLTSIPFEPAARDLHAGAADELVRSLPRTGRRLVFVNGVYAPALSCRMSSSQARGPVVLASLCDPAPEIERRLSRYANYRTHAFIALNTAFLTDGAFVYVAEGAIVDDPIHLVHVSVGGSQPQVSYPRNLIVVGEGAHATLIETYIGASAPENPYFTNAVTEIVAGPNAVLDHYKLQMESESGYHIATVQIEQGRGCAFRSHSFSFGAALARTEMNTVLSEGSECTFNGLYIGGGSQHMDSRTSIDHAQPHATSHELYKGILDQKSTAVFNGKIIVRKDAQKTDAKQTNKNLVLSEGSTINTKPELQIHADDVRCTHGATIGQLDKDSLFYLRTRGIGQDQAREMLIAAFAREIIDGVRVEELRNYIDRTLASRLTRNMK